jgi:hypothetical protein
MADNIFDTNVGDRLTRDQIIEAAGGGVSEPSASSSQAAGNTEQSPAQRSEGTTLSYPLDDDDYKARVVFTVVEDKATGNVVNDGVKSQVTDRQSELKAIEKQVDELSDEYKAENITKNQFNERLKALQDQKKELESQISTFNAAASATESAPRIGLFGTQVRLYLPAGLSFRDNVTYENFDLGGAGAAMEGGLGFAESMMKGVGSFVTNITGGGGADLAKLAAIQLSGKAGSFASELQAVQKLSGGLTMNPNSRVLFKQPNIREFSFAFKFVAKSAKEAEQVNEIIKFFRTELYPDEINANVGNTSISLGYRFPNKFKIQFFYRGEQIPHLAKIKDCYLRDVSTTYNASQMAMHSDGNFTEIDMTLSFQETRALVRKDVSEGGF